MSLSEGHGKRMVEDWISVYGFLEDKELGKVRALFEDGTCTKIRVVEEDQQSLRIQEWKSKI